MKDGPEEADYERLAKAVFLAINDDLKSWEVDGLFEESARFKEKWMGVARRAYSDFNMTEA